MARWTAGAASVSVTDLSARNAVSPVPLEAYEETEYPATVAVTPDTFPLRLSLNQKTTESIFPFPSESRVFLETIFGAIPSETAVAPDAARRLPAASETVPGTYEYVNAFAVSAAVESVVAKRYVFADTWKFAPEYVDVPLKESHEKFGDWSVSEKVASNE